MLTTSRSAADELVAQLHARMGHRWRINVTNRTVSLRPWVTPAAQPRATRSIPSTREVLDAAEARFAASGVPRAWLLPMRWRRDTDLTISAIQGLDPWLKDATPRVWREGFIPQPVVRFTGERDAVGQLIDGYLTSFVNLSCVQRVGSVAQHVELLDTWIGVLSAVGIHASRLTIHGSLTVWQRDTVSGLTMHVSCDGAGCADAVLLWNTAAPSFMACDLGSGLERLRWLLSGCRWGDVVFGDLAASWNLDLLDALRTATLLAMTGIRPAARGPGLALRRVLRAVPSRLAASGLGRLVRTQRAYWTEIGVTGIEWPQVSELIEDEIITHTRRMNTGK